MRLRGCLTRPRPGHGTIRRIFVGNHGVRAGWRLMIFLVLTVAVTTLLVVLAHWVHLAKALGLKPPHHAMHALPPLGPSYFLFNELLLLLPVLCATAIMSVLEATSLTNFGLNDRQPLFRFTTGYLFGLILILLLVATLILTGHGLLTSDHMTVGADISDAVIWFAVFLLVGFSEEFALRGYLLTTLTSGVGFWAAALLTSLLFGAIHGTNPGETIIGQITAFGAGLLFCIGIRLTGSLWWSIGVHAAWDWSESYLYGSNDSGIRSTGRLFSLNPHGNVYFSGGATGPEGSLFCLIILALACAAAYAMLLKTPRPPHNSQSSAPVPDHAVPAPPHK